MSHTNTISRFLITSIMLVTFVLTPAEPLFAATTYTPRTDLETIAYLQGVLAQLQLQLANQNKGATNANSKVRPNPYFVNVMTLAPERILRDQAILRGVVYTGSAKSVDAWFEYGTTASNLKYRSELYSNAAKTTARSGSETRAVRRRTTSTSNDSAPVTTTATRRRTSNSTSQEINVALTIDDLKADTRYIYRLVVEDDKGYRHYSPTRTLTTIAPASNESFAGAPGLDTEGVIKIGSSGATLQGFVTMNDYEEGLVFFLYGTDRNRVEDIEDEDYETYEDVMVTSSFQKVLVEDEFFGRDTVTKDISRLKAATPYYYRVCLAYDDNKKGDTVTCGQLESFVTAG